MVSYKPASLEEFTGLTPLRQPPNVLFTQRTGGAANFSLHDRYILVLFSLHSLALPRVMDYYKKVTAHKAWLDDGTPLVRTVPRRRRRHERRQAIWTILGSRLDAPYYVGLAKSQTTCRSAGENGSQSARFASNRVLLGLTARSINLRLPIGAGRLAIEGRRSFWAIRTARDQRQTKFAGW